MFPPDGYVETPEGLLLIADGLTPVMRWDGQADGLKPCGVTAPAAAAVLARNTSAADPRPAAPLTAPVIAKDATAAVPPLPSTPTAPTLAADHSRDEQFTGGEDPTTYLANFTGRDKGLKGSYRAAMRYQNARGDYSAWSPLSVALAVTRTNGSAYPPNVYALKYTGLAVPNDGTVVRRQLCINADLRTASASNASGAGNTAWNNYYIDLDTTDVASPTLLSNELVVRTDNLLNLASATKVDPLAAAAAATPLTGSFYAVVRYYDAQGRFSDFSAASTALTLAAADLAYGLKYTSVPVPTDPNVVGRQILRTTAADTSTYYVDVDTADLTSTTFQSLKTDAQLAATTAVTDRQRTAGLSGDYYAYVRFVDELGAYSDLSPVSGVMSVVPGEYVYGVTYTAVAVPTQANVVRRQILRNTGGQADTFYVDIDTTDLAATTFGSVRLDGELDNQEAVPMFTPDGVSLSNRFGVPPSFKTALASHSGRTFLAVDRVYSRGGVKVTNGSVTVTGVATAWTANMAGRFLYVTGSTASYEIASVNATTQVLTLLAAYAGATSQVANYAIRPAPAERRLVYYTEAGEPQSWPAVNGLSIQEDGDEITGLLSFDSFLFILERRHLYRFTFQADPATDGFVYLAANRGCVNDRCWVMADGTAYMLDEAGIHAFDGGSDPKPVSGPLRPMFTGLDPDGVTINWQASDLFHASLHADETTIRWFVALSGEYAPRHALCLFYGDGMSWWVEEYDRPISSSAAGTFQGRRRSFYGSIGGTYLSHESALDGLDAGAGRTRGRVSSADLHGLTDSAGGWPPGLAAAGASVTVVSGRGAGQRRKIVGQSDTRLRLRDPWLVLPDASSVYQIAGIGWTWLSGWFRWAADEELVPRKLEVVFRPTVALPGNEPAALVARVYRDFSAEPVVWAGKNKSADAEGFRCEAGGPDLIATMEAKRGYAQQRMPGMKELNTEGNRYVQVRLSGVSSDAPQLIRLVALDGAEG